MARNLPLIYESASSNMTEATTFMPSMAAYFNQTEKGFSEFPQKFISKLSNREDYIAGAALIITCFIAIIGNGGSIFMFWKRFKSITPAELLLFNLAWANLLLAGCSYPTNMVTFIVHRWVLGETGCKIYGFVCYLLGIANIMSVAALAVVRYCKTCTRRLGTAIDTRKVTIVIGGIYVFSTLWSILPLFGFGDYDVEPFGTSCTLDWANPSYSGQLYIALSVLLIVIIPAFVMIICYVKILILVRQNNSRFTKNVGKQSPASPSEFQLTMISFLVCLGFLGAWMPYAIVSVYYGMVRKRFPPIYVSLIPVLLAKSSCAYNPIIYVFVTARYRKDLSKLVYDSCGLHRFCRAFKKTRNNTEDSSTLNRDDDLTFSLEVAQNGDINASPQCAFPQSRKGQDSERLNQSDNKESTTELFYEMTDADIRENVVYEKLKLKISGPEQEPIGGITSTVL